MLASDQENGTELTTDTSGAPYVKVVDGTRNSTMEVRRGTWERQARPDTTTAPTLRSRRLRPHASETGNAELLLARNTLAAPEAIRIHGGTAGAHDGIRTRDPNLTKIVRYLCATWANFRTYSIGNVCYGARAPRVLLSPTPHWYWLFFNTSGKTTLFTFPTSITMRAMSLEKWVGSEGFEPSKA